MKNALLTLLGVSLYLMSFASGAMPGSPCRSVDGTMCHQGTRNCICERHEPGSLCRSVNGNMCHSGTRNCICE